MCDFIDPNIHIWSSVGGGGGGVNIQIPGSEKV